MTTDIATTLRGLAAEWPKTEGESRTLMQAFHDAVRPLNTNPLLVTIENVHAIGNLLETSADPALRFRAARVLSNIAARHRNVVKDDISLAVLEAIEKGLKDSEQVVRFEVVGIMQGLGMTIAACGPRVVDTLGGLLGDKDIGLADHAIGALYRIGRTIPTLKEAVRAAYKTALQENNYDEDPEREALGYDIKGWLEDLSRPLGRKQNGIEPG